MTTVGSLADLVNVTKVSLTNSTDNVTFGQLFNLGLDFDRAMVKKQTTDGNFKKFYSTGDGAIEGDILLTTAEISTLLGYTVLVNGDLVAKNWQLSFTPVGGGSAKTVTINAQCRRARLLRATEGGAVFNIRLELTSDTLTVA